MTNTKEVALPELPPLPTTSKYRVGFGPGDIADMLSTEEAHAYAQEYGALCYEAGRLAALAEVKKYASDKDDAAVDDFASSMKAKLAKKRGEGRGGWDDESQCEIGELAEMLIDHIPKGDPVDIANFCMMLHQREQMAVEHHPCYGGSACRAIQNAALRAQPQAQDAGNMIATLQEVKRRIENSPYRRMFPDRDSFIVGLIDEALNQSLTQPAQELCCGEYKTCKRACTSRGWYIAEQEFLQQQPAQAAVPEGWKPVPIELTEQMADALDYNTWPDTSGEKPPMQQAWSAVLNAAPESGEGL